MKAALARAASAAAIVVVLAVASRLLLTRPADVPEGRPDTPKQPPPTPTLYCEFYNFMHNATVVSFLFAVEHPSGDDRRFMEMAVVEPDGTRSGFEADRRPQWTRVLDDGVPAIASPDGATRIVLYGFEPGRPGVLWVEAGVRSETYKNLDGKCRQANFGASRG